MAQMSDKQKMETISINNSHIENSGNYLGNCYNGIAAANISQYEKDTYKKFIESLCSYVQSYGTDSQSFINLQDTVNILVDRFSKYPENFFPLEFKQHLATVYSCVKEIMLLNKPDKPNEIPAPKPFIPINIPVRVNLIKKLQEAIEISKEDSDKTIYPELIAFFKSKFYGGENNNNVSTKNEKQAMEA